MNRNPQDDLCFPGTSTQHTDDSTFALSPAGSDDTFLGDVEGAEEVAFIDLTADEEGASEELPAVDMLVDTQDSDNNTTMGDPKEIAPANANMGGRLSPKDEPRVDVDIDEGNIETDEEQLDQEAPIPEPFDFNENNIDTDGEHSEQEAHVSKSEQTAENGWIVILQTPEVPYDQDADPAGLYGGREVDDRPTLLEFYHQDARTNGHFAKMARTRAELAAEAVASKLAEAKSKVEEAKLESARTALPTMGKRASTGKAGILKLRPPKGDIPSPPNRSYADVLTGVSRTSATSNKANVLPSRSVANVSFSPGSKGKNTKEKVMNIFHKWQLANNVKPKSNAENDYWEAIHREQDERDKSFWVNGVDGVPLYRTKPVRTWKPDPDDRTKRVLHITNPDPEEDVDAERDIAKPSVEVNDEAELEKAIALSLEQHEREMKQKGKEAAELKENVNPDTRKTLDASSAAETKEITEFHKQCEEVDRLMAMIGREGAKTDPDIDASRAKEKNGEGKQAAKLKENIDASSAARIKEMADFPKQCAEVDRLMAMIGREGAKMNAVNGASKAEEEADLELAIWESMKGSPFRKRKSSSQSLPDDGSSGESEAWRAEREWMSPKGGEKRSHKRCKLVTSSDSSVEESDSHTVSPKKNVG